MWSLVDVAEIRQRVEDAKARARSEPHALVSFGVSGIQRMLVASQRQPGIRGASELVRRFDRACREALPGWIFCAGGHGLALVPQARRQNTETQIRARFDEIPAGTLSIAAIAFEPDREAECLEWLRAVERAGRETAPRRLVELPHPTNDDLCPSCFQRTGEHEWYWPEANERRSICELCFALFRADRLGSDGEKNRNLAQLSSSNRLAMISADGNELGALFDGARTLVAHAVVSAGVSTVFEGALQQLETTAGDRALVPVTGGDDVRIFADPAKMPALVSDLLRHIRERSARAAEELRSLDGAAAAGVARIGVGMGIIVAHAAFPATRFAKLAKVMERRAKRYCAQKRVRSAIDIAFLNAGDELDQGVDAAPTALSGDERGSPDVPRWADFVQRARALAKHVPATQRAQVVVARRQPETFANYFRYQIARSNEWRAYLDAVGIPWADPDLALAGAPYLRDHEMARLLEGTAQEDR